MQSKLAAILLVLGLTAPPLWATPHGYALDAANSTVDFVWMFGPDPVHGRMQVGSADLSIDFATLANSRVNVVVDVTSAEAGFPFATQAMKGPKVLDAAQYPQISFVSSAVHPAASGATINGQITIRGVSRPMTFAAEIYRQSGTEAGDLSHLTILLTGTLKRSEFGANGWSGQVGDDLTLRIIGRINRVG